MSELTDLYQQVLLDHYRSPRNRGRPPGADHSAEGHNPLCGDRIAVHVELDGDRLAAVGFEGSGCAIAQASASLMSEAVRGLDRAAFERLFAAFRAAVTGGAPDPAIELGKLEALAGVAGFPMRVKCATLAWHALEAALEAGPRVVSTE